jgi:hypothetical protein
MATLLSENSGRMLLSIQMIVDVMNEKLWEFSPHVQGDRPILRGCQFYTRGMQLREDTLYIIPEGEGTMFPIHRYCYVTSEDLFGAAPNIHGLHRPLPEIANLVLSVFRMYHDFETALIDIVNGGGSLTDLCREGEKFFNNPMFIHDSMFAVIGLPRDIGTTTQFEHNANSGLYHIPLRMIDEFKYDTNYQATLTEHSAGLWDYVSNRNGFRSLYVNLWDNASYCGRLLINERQTALKPGQFKAAEYFAEYAMMIIRRDIHSADKDYRSFDATLTALATGREVDAEEMRTMLDIMGWKAGERYICLRIRSQDTGLAVNPVSVMRSVLATELSNFTSFFYDQQLCILMNLSISGFNPGMIHQRLAPLIRDNYMCGGISNPFVGMSMFPAAFEQAAAALSYANGTRSNAWLISFEDCALEYIESSVLKTMPLELIIAPYLYKLLGIDRDRGTEYYRTLRAWLLNERSIPKTAEALIVHRTTLTYRLEKLRELIPIDLDDPDLRLYLLLSYHLMDTRTDRGTR